MQDSHSNKPEKYRVIIEGGQGEIEEKKSRFICSVMPVQDEQEAAAFIEQTKKKYWDARHNCSAFVLGERQELTRCSDDGEPGGTAGRPMLEVLLGEGICNVCVVVTRYFGGTLLGTGGLVRAYTQAVKAGLEASAKGTMILAVPMEIGTDYNGVGKIQYILAKEEIPIVDSNYGADVVFHIAVPVAKTGSLKKQLIEATAGQVRLQEKEITYLLQRDS